MNKSRQILATMVLNGDTKNNLAKALGISRQTLNSKLLGTGQFNQSEIQTMMDRYDLTPTELIDLFFDSNCQKECKRS